MKNDQNAFPVTYGNDGVEHGMTLRDYFAAKALQGILASSAEWSDVSWDACKARVEDSYNISDEMLKVRDEKK
jgi:hypothetical protein